MTKSKLNEKKRGEAISADRLTNRNLLQWIRSILRPHEEELTTLPEDVKRETVEKLIGKAQAGLESMADGAHSEADETGNSAKSDAESVAQAESESKEEGKGCKYAMKRNMVASLQEIRKFAEEHHLASAMVKSLLTLLAEMALNALKGKVSASALMILLNALNFDKSRKEAYKEGEKAGRNAKIMEEYFPKEDDGVPHLEGAASLEGGKRESIFDIAKNA